MISSLIHMSTHDDLLIFTNKGKVYRLKGYNIPEFGRTAKGLPIVNILNLDKDGAVLKRIRKGYSESGVLLEYTINYYDAKLYRYSVEVASIEKVR